MREPTGVLSTRGSTQKSLEEALAEHGITRRQFLRWCAMITATLALPARYTRRVAEAVMNPDRPSLIWLEFQDCAGNTESFLRAEKPTVAEIVLEVLSLNYHETIMAPAGEASRKSRDETVEKEKGKYLVVVEGSIPTKDDGVYCTIGGESAVDIAKRVCGNAAAVLAVGSCAAFGGIPAANPNPTGAVGVRDLVKGVPVVNLPGCPANVANVTATIVHFLTFGALPETDSLGRPLFAYGQRIHDNCPRRAHFDAGQFVQEWGDEGHRLGWCLYKMGCKGPVTWHNCPSIQWNGGTSWPIGAGHPCISCSEPAFWDRASPFYRHLPKVAGFGVETTAEKVGLGLAGLTAAGFGAHAVATAIRRRVSGVLAGTAPAEGGPPGERGSGARAES